MKIIQTDSKTGSLECLTRIYLFSFSYHFIRDLSKEREKPKGITFIKRLTMFYFIYINLYLSN